MTVLETYEERKPILDDFFSSIEAKSREVKESEGYKNLKQLEAGDSFISPEKSKMQASPTKSPLRKAKSQFASSPTKPSKNGM